MPTPPPPTLTLDRIEQAALQIDGAVKQCVRCGYATHLPTDDPQDVLWSILDIANCPKLGDPLSATRQDLWLQRLIARPVPPDQARVQLIYSSPLAGFTPSAYVITDDTMSVSYRSDMIPGTRTPIRVGWTSPSDANIKVQPDNVTFDITRSHKAMSVAALLVGKPETDNSDYTDHVNDGTWKGKPAGYWKLSRYRTSISKYSGYYSLDAVAETRIIEDWSEFGILVDRRTGKKVDVAASTITTALAKDYSYGIIYGSAAGETDKGLVRVGHYKTANFATIFGFN